MTNEQRAVREIHDIRLKLHDKTKDMTEKEVSDYYAKATREVEEMYGIKFRRPDDVSARKVM